MNEKCNAYLENNSIGKVNIKYDEILKNYIINASFTKAGKIDLIILDENGKKNVYDLSVSSNIYDTSKK